MKNIIILASALVLLGFGCQKIERPNRIGELKTVDSPPVTNNKESKTTPVIGLETTTSTPEYSDNSLMVLFDPKITLDKVKEELKTVGATVIQSYSSIPGVYAVKIPTGTVEQKIKQIDKLPGVIKANPNQYSRPF